MNRHALRHALGRAGSAPTARSQQPLLLAQHYPQSALSTPTPTSFFSTTPPRPNDDSSNNNNPDTTRRTRQLAAVDKLAQLGQRSNQSSASPSSESSSPKFRSLRRGGAGAGAIDARSLRSSLLPSSSASTSASSAPRVLNLRSLRGGRGGTTAFRRAGLSDAGIGGEAGPARPRLGGGGAGSGVFRTSRDGGGEGDGRGRGGFGRGAFSGRRGGGGFEGRRLGFGEASGRGGARGRGRGRGRGRARGSRGERKKDNEDDKHAPDSGKVTLSPEEQAVVFRLDQGEVVPFHPQVTRASLRGYGPAVVTDAGEGQVETAIRTMRLMTGGMAFNADSGVTADVTHIKQRARQNLPFFVHSEKERSWINQAMRRHRFVEPAPELKQAIVDATIRGTYKTTGFAEMADITTTMANYHARTFTYRASDSQKFMDKVLSLLPAQAAAKPAAARPTK